MKNQNLTNLIIREGKNNLKKPVNKIVKLAFELSLPKYEIWKLTMHMRNPFPKYTQAIHCRHFYHNATRYAKKKESSVDGPSSQEESTLWSTNRNRKKKDDQIRFDHFFAGTIYSPITLEQLKLHLSLFKDFFTKKYPKSRFLFLQFKVRFINGQVRSLSRVQILSTKDFGKCLTVFSQVFDRECVLESDANVKQLDGEIIFLFKPIKDDKELTESKFVHLEERNQWEQGEPIKPLAKYAFFELKDFKIPRHMKVSEWPHATTAEDGKSASGFKVNFNKDNVIENVYSFQITIGERENLTDIYKDKVLLWRVRDSYLGSNLHPEYFKRTVTHQVNEDENTAGVKTYYLNNGEVISSHVTKQMKNINTINPSTNHQARKIITMDFETRNINGILVPLCLSVYDGKKAVTYYFRDADKWKEDLKGYLLKYFIRKYNYSKIYFHNFAKFDGIFILAVLVEIADVVPILKDGSIMQLTATLKESIYNEMAEKEAAEELKEKSKIRITRYGDKNEKKPKPKALYKPYKKESINENENSNENEKGKSLYTLVFRDSIMLLPSSLDSIAKSFGVEQQKTIFPVLFTEDENFSLDYCGHVPEYKYFPGASKGKFSLADYEKYKSEFTEWSLIEEITKYCENDTIALHQVLVSFTEHIYKKFNVDIVQYPTLSSVAFAIYRSKYLKDVKEKIPIIKDSLFEVLKHGYYGGITETYKMQGVDVHSYDVNSLYPHAMLSNKMPVGDPIKFTGNPYLISDNPFGFFLVTVETPDMIVPILPHRVTTKGGVRTACPTGTWKGWYFSEEIKNAEKYGYKFIIHEGYMFKAENIFKGYVEDLYEIKCNTPSSDPMYTIVKLLLNALYGRMGLNPNLDTSSIVENTELEEIALKKTLHNIITLTDKYSLITVAKKFDELETYSKKGRGANTSIPIAAAVSAYSRIEMSKYLTRYATNLYAIDTDGIKVDCHIDKEDIDSKILGKMKYEFTFSRAVFPAPKVYGGLLKNEYKGYGRELVKVKGVKKPIPFHKLSLILQKDKQLTIPQEKWYRNIGKSYITIKQEAYTLTLTDNKREVIRNSWGEAIYTRPLFLVDGIIQKVYYPPVMYLPKDTNYYATTPFPWCLYMVEYIIYIMPLYLQSFTPKITSLVEDVIWIHTYYLNSYLGYSSPYTDTIVNPPVYFFFNHPIHGNMHYLSNLDNFALKLNHYKPLHVFLNHPLLGNVEYYISPHCNLPRNKDIYIKANVSIKNPCLKDFK